MGSHHPEVEDILPYSFKVHSAACSKLMIFIDRVIEVLREVEDFGPGCSSGIKALCLLRDAIEKGKLLLRNCSDASKLYLAVTGDAIVSRCRRTTKLMENSLDQIQSMVPVTLALKISQLIEDMKLAVFSLESSEEEAGKAVRELLQRKSSASVVTEEVEIKALQFAAYRLHILTPKTILIEKRCIKRSLAQVGDGDSNKKKVLMYLLHLLGKYGNAIKDDQKNYVSRPIEPVLSTQGINDSLSVHPVETDCNGHPQPYGTRNDIPSGAAPPEEFRCPLSSRIMYDPVLIASGETFERMWIQRWLEEGNRTCPKTKVRLDHLSLTPNWRMKDLISKWCLEYGLTVQDPSQKPCSALEVSLNSITSLCSYINDFCPPSDVSSVSLDTSDYYDSETSNSKILNESTLRSSQSGDDSSGFHGNTSSNEDLQTLSGLSDLPREAQIEVVEDLTHRLKNHNWAYHAASAKGFVEPLVKYLKDCHDCNELGAANAGFQLLLAFLMQNRSEIEDLGRDAFHVLSSFLITESSEEVVKVMEELSGSPRGRKMMMHSSCVLPSLLNILDAENRSSQASSALKILRNMSSSKKACAEMLNLPCVQKLCRYLEDPITATDSVIILRNMCDLGEGRASIVETEGCISSVAELLESETKEVQEKATAILLSLCSQSDEYCRFVLGVGVSVIPSLFHISLNGNKNARAYACELLRVLREIDWEDEGDPVAQDPPPHTTPASNPNCNRRRTIFHWFRRRVV